MRVQAIINPISGVGSKRKIPRLLELMCEKAGHELSLTFTEYAGHASRITREEIDKGTDCIIAVGGDGTVNEIARQMINSKSVLGIVPMGSGNGLARELHIPMDPKKALEIIWKGRKAVIDSCRANDRVFFCTCGVGFDAAVSQKFAKEKRRGSITYLKNAIEEYLSYKPEVYNLLIGSDQVSEKAFLIACGNASQYGNNAYIAPRADIQDGKMNVTIMSPFTMVDIPELALQLFTKHLDKNTSVKTLETDKLSIVRSKPGIMHLDGEPVWADSRIDISVIPDSLNVFVPENTSNKKEIKELFGEVYRFLDRRIPFIFR